MFREGWEGGDTITTTTNSKDIAPLFFRFPFTSSVVGRRVLLSSSCVSVGGACIKKFTFFFFFLLRVAQLFFSFPAR